MTGPMREVAYGNRLNKTLEIGQEIADRWGHHVLIIRMAREIKTRWNAETKADEARAIRSWIQTNVKYFADPHGVEMVGEPLWTLKNGGDCDDMAALAAAMLIALGHNARMAAVKWKGRADFTHAVVADLTAQCIVDPVSVPPEIWPPMPYQVQSIMYVKPGGEIATLDGLFGNLVKALAKPFTKIFKPHTLLGKIVDPLGLASRNLKWTQKAADVVGTAAVVVAGGWALGAATAGTGAGFWATAGAGAKVAGAAALKAATGIGSAAKWAAGAIAPALLGKGGGAEAPAGSQVPQGILPSEMPIGYQPGGDTGMMPYGGGGGMVSGPSVDPNSGMTIGPDGIPGKTVEVTGESENNFPWLLLGAGAVGIMLLMSAKKKRRVPA